jgi:hypothetical protein
MSSYQRSSLNPDKTVTFQTPPCSILYFSP